VLAGSIRHVPAEYQARSDEYRHVRSAGRTQMKPQARRWSESFREPRECQPEGSRQRSGRRYHPTAQATAHGYVTPPHCGRHGRRQGFHNRHQAVRCFEQTLTRQNNETKRLRCKQRSGKNPNHAQPHGRTFTLVCSGIGTEVLRRQVTAERYGRSNVPNTQPPRERLWVSARPARPVAAPACSSQPAAARRKTLGRAGTTGAQHSNRQKNLGNHPRHTTAGNGTLSHTAAL